MGTLWKIAFRNVLRHKRRTAITGVVLMFGIGVYIMFGSMLAGMDRMSIDSMVDYSTASAKVTSPGYLETMSGTPLDFGLENPAAIERAALAAGASGTTRRTAFVGQLSNYVDALPVMAFAVDPATDGTVFALERAVDAGEWFPGREANEIVLGRKLAAELGLSVGDWVVLSGRTRPGAENADEFVVVATVDAADPQVSNSGAYVSYGAAEEFLELDGLVTELDLALPRAATLDRALDEADALAAALRAEFPELSTRSVKDQAADYLAMRNMKSKFSYVMMLVVLLIGGVGIVNTILMAVYARVKEIGVLRAYGMLGRDVKSLFTIEGVIVGAIGSLAGALFGLALTWYMVEYGIPVGVFFADGGLDMGNLPLTGSMYGEWKPLDIVVGFVFGVVVSFIAARIPARRAARLEVTDALRFV
ncbi:MAG: ABC transporter permease [Spirochaetales bacterium]|nr:ABC transporter permease [Spirochaetales bacterium]